MIIFFDERERENGETCIQYKCEYCTVASKQRYRNIKQPEKTDSVICLIVDIFDRQQTASQCNKPHTQFAYTRAPATTYCSQPLENLRTSAIVGNSKYCIHDDYTLDMKRSLLYNLLIGGVIVALICYDAPKMIEA